MSMTMATQFADTGAQEQVGQEQQVEQPGNEGLDAESFYDNQDAAEPSDEELAQIDDDGGEAEQPIAPPTSWKSEDREGWETLPRNMQETILRREAERDRLHTVKDQEAKQAERRIQNEALAQLAQIQRNSATELERYASMFAPQPPDPKLLYTGNPNDALTYQQQDFAHKQALAQQQQLQQEAQQRTEEAQRIEEQQALTERQADAARLQEVLPDWFDADKGPKLQAELQSIGSLLGYPVELMAQATANDILALKTVADLKVKADKFDKWMSRKMSAVSRARQLPNIARPGAAGGQQATSDPVKLLYPND